MINPFVLGAIREREMQAALRRELIRMDLAGNTNYLNPQLYTAYLGGAPIPVDPVAAAEVAQAQVYAPEVYLPGLPVVPGTYVPQVPMQDPRQLAMAGLRDSDSLEGYAFNLQRQELLRRINERLDAVRVAEAAQTAAMLQAAADKTSASDDPYLLPQPEVTGALTGLAATAGAAAATRSAGKSLGAGTLAAGLAAAYAYKIRKDEEKRRRALARSERIMNNVLLSAAAGGLAGFGLGHTLSDSGSAALPGAIIGAGLGGVTGYGYSKFRNGVEEL